ncbi:hypothetical protein [Cupriavidus taiwanensis]|uniref:hypothetical protein n=1 Tax=Cupriavidus taiwanensis TaxID=164546 RepID=UPI000E1B523F|nr:hypothetical protein [Cupriavidus taiwanensis]SOZ97309.1 hypothetical protein CBM2598_U70001 [Cupriavidus taiwanensis]
MSAFSIDDLESLAEEIRDDYVEATEKAERLSAQWGMVMSRIERLREKEAEAPDPDDPNDERNYPPAEYDERMQPLENPHSEDGSWDDDDDQEDRDD